MKLKAHQSVRQRLRLDLLDYHQQFLFAEVDDELILSTETLNAHRFVRDLRKSALKAGQKK